MTSSIQNKNVTEASFWDQLQKVSDKTSFQELSQKCMRAVFEGEREAVTFLGYMHEKGLNGSPNIKQALELYATAVTKGCLYAKYRLCHILINNPKLVINDPQLGFLDKSKCADPDLREEGFQSKCRQEIQGLAMVGFRDACFTHGQMCLQKKMSKTIDIHKPTYEYEANQNKAIECLMDAAREKWPEAYCELGNIYREKQLNERRYERKMQLHDKAFDAYLKGAELRNPEAMFWVGRYQLFQEKNRLLCDTSMAPIQWIRKAALHGHCEAVIDYAKYLYNKENRQIQTLETYQWAKKAAALGNSQFKRIITEMSPIIKYEIIRRYQMNPIQNNDKDPVRIVELTDKEPKNRVSTANRYSNTIERIELIRQNDLLLEKIHEKEILIDAEQFKLIDVQDRLKNTQDQYKKCLFNISQLRADHQNRQKVVHVAICLLAIAVFSQFSFLN